MSQASATKLIPKLRFKVNARRNLRNVEGPKGRHDKIKKTVTALLKHERIELNYNRADECRGYAERLISDAIRYGDCHKPTMEMASYWIIEKPIIHKLFKVLAPRYENSTVSYTKMWRAPRIYPSGILQKCVLELRDNIYPPLGPDKSYNQNLIHNVLLEEAKKVYRQEKAQKAGSKESEEQIKPTETGETQPDNSQNVQATAASSNDVDSEKISMTDQKSELPDEEKLILDSVKRGESEHNSEVDSSLEKNLDLNKIKLTEEKK